MKDCIYQINIFSLQIKIHEVYVKEIPQRQSLIAIEEEDEENKDITREDLLDKEQLLTHFLNTNFSIKNLSNHQT